MPYRSAFFDASSGDRVYTSDRWAQIFAAIVTQGYIPGFGNELQVIEASPASMNIRINLGAGFIQGRYFEVYTTPLILAISAAHATLHRNDLVVLKLDLNSGVRDVVPYIKQGSNAATQGAAAYPSLQRDSTIYEVALAGVYVAPADTSITNSEITDLRNNVSYMGRSSLPDLSVHKAASPVDHPAGSGVDAFIGPRTATPTMVPTNSGPHHLTTWVSYLSNRVARIVGISDSTWYVDPPTGANLTSLKSAADSLLAVVSGHTTTLTTHAANIATALANAAAALTQLAGKTANDAANQIPVYDANRRVFDSVRLGGLLPNDAASNVPVYDANRRVFDSNRLEGATWQPSAIHSVVSKTISATSYAVVSGFQLNLPGPGRWKITLEAELTVWNSDTGARFWLKIAKTGGTVLIGNEMQFRSIAPAPSPGVQSPPIGGNVQHEHFVQSIIVSNAGTESYNAYSYQEGPPAPSGGSQWNWLTLTAVYLGPQ